MQYFVVVYIMFLHFFVLSVAIFWSKTTLNCIKIIVSLLVLLSASVDYYQTIRMLLSKGHALQLCLNKKTWERSVITLITFEGSVTENRVKGVQSSTSTTRHNTDLYRRKTFHFRSSQCVKRFCYRQACVTVPKKKKTHFQVQMRWDGFK